MKDRIYRLLVLLLLMLAVYFCVLAYKEHKPFEVAETAHQAIVQTVVKKEETNDPLKRQIDFDTLCRVNTDIIGWLYIPQLEINEPILKGQTDTEYLNKSFDGTYSPLGSVFTYAHVDEKLADPHICLFGHNMMSGQIFGKLERFKDETVWKTDPNLYVYTPERVKMLEIQSVYTCLKDDVVFQDDWTMEEENGQTFTLATCDGYTQTANRLVVNCRVVKEKIVF